MPTFPQVKQNLPARADALPDSAARRGRTAQRRARTAARACSCGRRARSRVVRLLAEAQTEAEARELSATIAALVRRELG